SASEVSSSSSVDSGVAGRGILSARAILHALSCFSFLFLFLSAATSAASFRFFTASACRQMTSHSSGIRDLEGWHLRLTPCKAQSNQSQEVGKGIPQIDNGLKSRLTTERYPSSGCILISQRLFASSRNSATAFLALREAMPRGSSTIDVLEPEAGAPGVRPKIGRLLSMRGITICR